MAKRLIVSGNVQGVGYRWYVKSVATALNVKGSVKNLADGTVEIVVERPSDEFLERVRTPVYGTVEAVKEHEIDAAPMEDFEIQF